MQKYLDLGYDILCLCFASVLSTTYQSACIAASSLRERFPERTILVLDSLMASGGEGLLVYKCAMMQQRGESLKSVYQYAECLREKICGWFTVEDILSLKRGGRIDPTTAVQGSALSIMPIFHFKSDGKLEMFEKKRGRKASLSALVDHVEETIINSEEQDIFVTYGDCFDDAQSVVNELSQRIRVKKIYTMPVGPIIATHCGPSLVMVYFIGKEK